MAECETNLLPRVLIIDDLYGRETTTGTNQDREQLCGRFLLRDVTGSASGKERQARVRKPIADAVFFRGQKPERASVGDFVENDLNGCLAKVREGWNGKAMGKCRWSLVLLDLCFYTGPVTKDSDLDDQGMPEGRADDDSATHYFGLTILQALRRDFPDVPVVIFSSKPRCDVSYLVDREGAKAFLPRDDAKGPELLRQFIKKYALVPDSSGIIVGQSLPLLKVLRDARMASISDDARNQNLLILGETGVGKELLARFLHAESPRRRDQPFVVVNCPQLQPSLAFSELFGIGSKVATGVDKRKGAIDQASGGDLFLDEVADLPSEVRPGILRFLECREIQPFGSSETREIDLRFISATNADLDEMSSKGQFRSDLLYRLAAVRRLVLPPLRQRPEDIPILAEHFVRKAGECLVDAAHQLTTEAMEVLQAHSWPGNVRELRNIVFRAVTHNPDVEYLHPTHFELPESGTPTTSSPRVPAHPTPQDGVENAAAAVSAIAANGHVAPESLKNTLETVNFDGMDYGTLSGFLPQLQEAYAGLLWRYLLVARELSKKPPTPDKPEGEYSYHRLGKLLSGNQRLTATEAGRLLKRVLKTDPKTEALAREDPFLKEFL